MMPSPDALTDIRSAVNSAERQFQVIDGGRHGGGGGGGVPPETERDDAPCPVQPLGHLDGKFYFLDAVGQVRALAARALGSREELMSLFFDEGSWLRGRFPLKKMIETNGPDGQPEKVEKIVDFRKNAASAWLMSICREQGLFGDHLMIRRPGVWPEKGGMPVVHCGDAVLIGDRYSDAGTRTGNQIWAAAPPTPRPGAPAESGIGRELQARIKEFWNFRKVGGEIAVMGLIGCAYYGAAIPWRPAGFLSGPAGCGKSSLLSAMRALFPLAFFTNDTSKAGLEQSLDGRAMPSFIDEAGDREDQRGARALLDLVLAASGGEGTKGSRGGQDGKARKIEVAGAIIMASICPPDMQAQHKDRFTIVELGRAEKGADYRAEHTDLVKWGREHGAALWGRAIANWESYHRSLASFREALQAKGCAPREMDQLGALMAGWWIMTHDGVPDDRGAEEGVGALIAFMRDEDDTVSQDASMQMVNHLMSQIVQVQRSTERKTIAALVRRYLDKDSDPSAEGVLNRNVAAEVLGQYGIRVIREAELKDKRGREIPRMADGIGVWFSPSCDPLSRLFDGTSYAGQRWQHELRRLESARQRSAPMRIGEMTARGCVWVSGEELGFGEVEYA